MSDSAESDAARLHSVMERAEALARQVETECTHESRTGRDWCCSHCHSIAYAIRNLTRVTSPADSGAER